MNYIFKVVTPKKTLALSAPSEEEEVKWISAIRALIARRAKEVEAGVTTGGHVKESSKEKEGEVGASKGIAPATSQSGVSDERKRQGPNKNGSPLLNNVGPTTTTTTAATVGPSAPARGAPPP